MRDLTGPAQSRAIRDVLQSLFVLEAVRPSKPLWILSAWITDAPMLDNSARQFASIDPEWESGPVVLSAILGTILERGGEINLITRPHEINRPFIQRLEALKKAYRARLRIVMEENFHDKGLLGADYELAGSMNFTRKGVTVNSEHVILRTDPAIVAQRHLETNALWKARVDADAGS